LLAVGSIMDVAWVWRWAAMHEAYTDTNFWWRFLPPTISNPLILAVIYFSRSWRLQIAALVANLLFAQYAFAPWYIDTVSGP
jgi:hypothetical protein